MLANYRMTYHRHLESHSSNFDDVTSSKFEFYGKLLTTLATNQKQAKFGRTSATTLGKSHGSMIDVFHTHFNTIF